MFYPICSENELIEGQFFCKVISEIKIIAIRHKSNVYIIENKCGHFGLPLESGYLEGDTIVCRQHGISFKLSTGEISNKPYENCDPILTFPAVRKKGIIGMELF